MNKFDLFLQRTTSIAQIVLVVIAAFTIFYSVIPLYQKELASEQLARVQIEQLAAEERLNFLNSSYELQLQEAGKVRLEMNSLLERSKNERIILTNLTTEIKLKDLQLSNANSLLAKTNNTIKTINTKLLQSDRLKFIQAIDWYTLIEPRDSKCDMAMRKFTRPDDNPEANIPKYGCDPYETVKLAIFKVQQPNAKDSSGDKLIFQDNDLASWTRKAVVLMEQSKYKLADKMDYTHRDELMREADAEIDRSGTQEEINLAFNKSLDASMAMLRYEDETHEKHRSAIKFYINQLRNNL